MESGKARDTMTFPVIFVTQVKTPSARTLAKYGLELADWEAFLLGQGGVCAICRTVPKSGMLCIDHEHRKGFSKMSAQDKRKCVRGLACFACNKYRIAKNSLDSADLVVQYLARHEQGRQDG